MPYRGSSKKKKTKKIVYSPHAGISGAAGKRLRQKGRYHRTKRQRDTSRDSKVKFEKGSSEKDVFRGPWGTRMREEFSSAFGDSGGAALRHLSRRNPRPALGAQPNIMGTEKDAIVSGGVLVGGGGGGRKGFGRGRKGVYPGKRYPKRKSRRSYF